MPVIGVGGIDSGDAAVAKLRAGATLVQLYSGLIFQGPGLLSEIKRALLAELEEQGCEKLGDLVGIDAADITAQPWPV
jgi:dihydroorotate dehydrogenase